MSSHFSTADSACGVPEPSPTDSQLMDMLLCFQDGLRADDAVVERTLSSQDGVVQLLEMAADVAAIRTCVSLTNIGWHPRLSSVSDRIIFQAIAVQLQISLPELQDEDLDRVISLDLKDLPIEDLAAVATCRNLRLLDFDGTVVSDLSPLANLSALEVVSCNDTGVWDTSPLRSLPHLRLLELERTRARDLPALEGVCHVRSASDRTIFQKIAEQLRVPLRDLHHDDLDRVTNLNLKDLPIEDLAAVATCKNLRVLNLDGTRVSDLAPLARLARLEVVSCNDTGVWDVSPLRSLPNLRVVELDRTQVSDLSGLEPVRLISIANTPVSPEHQHEFATRQGNRGDLLGGPTD